MDTDHMIANLISGSLIKILDAGTHSESVAFIVRDDRSRSGFRIIYQPFEDENTSPHGKQVTPQGATNGGGVIDSKKEQVEHYLIESFGLTARQARHVVDEAHSFRLAP
jgi:hypothetical protein